MTHFTQSKHGGRSRTNPWRQFKSREGAELLAWVDAGNVGVILNSPHPVGRRGQMEGSLWAKTDALLVEAGDAIGLRPVGRLWNKFYDNDPFPHFLLPGKFLTRAYEMCGYKPQTRFACDVRAKEVEAIKARRK